MQELSSVCSNIQSVNRIIQQEIRGGENNPASGKWTRSFGIHGTPRSQVPKVGLLSAVSSERGDRAMGGGGGSKNKQ